MRYALIPGGKRLRDDMRADFSERAELLMQAHAQPNAAEATDDAQVVERAGHPVSVVKSDASNLKVTTKEDMALANAILKARPIKRVPRLGAFEEAQW
ncbi:MAG: 2-C-methyl-D-erythritol 4-phosphate cytidylyltransferase [Proteobacteria bacterium]|nr:2-C-methyl-D-erythritol 4-phosphate cytidylyltransferase [Pseudomonadota bacterium]